MQLNSTRRQELILAISIALEIAFFAITGQNFLSRANFFECIRLSVEIGLLALALTPVIVTGGIDLSVGSMMRLCAVSLGGLQQVVHLPLASAAALTLLLRAVGGPVNAGLIS